MKTGCILFFLYFGCPAFAFLQTVSIDSSFGPNGSGYTRNLGSDAIFLEMAIQTDKRIVNLGFETVGNDSMNVVLSRLDPSGLRDISFGQGGVVRFETIPYYDGFSRDLLILGNGKILGAIYVNSDDEPGFIIFRINENGSIDSTFADNGFFKATSSEEDFSPLSIAIDEQENIFLFGSNQYQQAIRKLLPDGTPDPSFGNEGIAMMPTFMNHSSTEWGRDINWLPNGQFITTARVDDNDLDLSFVTSRWNEDGTPDTGFGINGSQRIFEGNIFSNFCSIHPQPDGKILYKDYYSFGGEINLTRLEENGVPDATFGENGIVKMEDTYGPISNDALLICPDGSFLMPFSVEDSARHNYLARFNPDFSIDSSFATDGKFELPEEILGLGSISILFQEEKKIVLNVFSHFFGQFYFTSLVRLNLEGHTSTDITNTEETKILIFPNPASEIITIRFTLEDERKMNLDLIDAQGRTIQTFVKNQFVERGDNEMTYNLNNQIQPGMYYLRVVSENQQQVHPIIIIQN